MEIFPGYSQMQAELEQAHRARDQGNEGMARVCARRAVGIALGEYFKSKGYSTSITSSYGRLQYLCEIHDESEDVRQVASHFLVRITPEHTLPIEADLISDSYWLINRLLDIDIRLLE